MSLHGRSGAMKAKNCNILPVKFRREYRRSFILNNFFILPGYTFMP